MPTIENELRRRIAALKVVLVLECNNAKSVYDRKMRAVAEIEDMMLKMQLDGNEDSDFFYNEAKEIFLRHT